MDVISRGRSHDHDNDIAGNHKYGDSDNDGEISTTPVEKTEQIMFELSNYQRLMIMFKLKELTNSTTSGGRSSRSEVNSSLSRLSKDLGLLVHEVHRNTNRLVDSGIITKD